MRLAGLPAPPAALPGPAAAPRRGCGGAWRARPRVSLPTGVAGSSPRGRMDADQAAAFLVEREERLRAVLAGIPRVRADVESTASPAGEVLQRAAPNIADELRRECDAWAAAGSGDHGHRGPDLVSK